MVRLLPALLASACWSCSSTGSVPIDGDADSTFPTVRAILPLGGGDTWRNGLEVAATEGDGSDRQQLLAGQTLSVGGVLINGPASVATELDVRLFGLAYRRSIGLADVDGEPTVALLGGIGVLDAEITATVPGQVLTDDGADPYFWGGIELGTDLSERARVWGRLELPLIGESMVGQLELVAAYSFGAASVFAGWRHLDVNWDRPGSDVEYRLSGPVIGLRWSP